MRNILLALVLLVFFASSIHQAWQPIEMEQITIHQTELEEMKAKLQQMTTNEVIATIDASISDGLPDRKLHPLFMAELKSRLAIIVDSLVRLGFHDSAGVFHAHSETDMAEIQLQFIAIKSVLKKLLEKHREEQLKKPDFRAGLFLFPHRLTTHEV